jgi:hypothetical protein
VRDLLIDFVGDLLIDFLRDLLIDFARDLLRDFARDLLKDFVTKKDSKRGSVKKKLPRKHTQLLIWRKLIQVK